MPTRKEDAADKLVLAHSLIKKADFKAAASVLKEVVAIDKKNGEAWFLLGATSGQSRDLHKMVTCSEKAIECNFNRASSYYNIGVAQRLLGNLDKALEAFKRVLRFPPPNQEAVNQYRAIKHEMDCKKTRTTTISGGVAICTPDSLEFLTTYVLLEQEDWFENEIRFVRKLIKPGDLVIDIGANYGLYSLTMARNCGPDGRVVAFEPVRATIEKLNEGVKANGFENILTIQKAISNFEGEVKIYLGNNSEMNSLTQDKTHGRSETVSVASLDGLIPELDLNVLDFIKIDAEGEEQRIIEGAQSFFERYDPLVMIEVKHGESVNINLLDRFATLGYESYRLVPGLLLLVPYSSNDSVDSIQLNIFCCKESRRDELVSRGLLMPATGGLEEGAEPDKEAWARHASDLPYINAFAQADEASPAGHAEYMKALAWYAVAHSGDATGYEKYHALNTALKLVNDSLVTHDGLARKLSRVRLLYELGFQGGAVGALNDIAEKIDDIVGSAINEPFAACCPHFDNTACTAKGATNWLRCCILETRELINKFTTYSSTPAQLGIYQTIRATGYSSCNIERRYQLIRVKHGLGISRDDNHRRLLTDDCSLNQAFWKAQL